VSKKNPVLSLGKKLQKQVKELADKKDISVEDYINGVLLLYVVDDGKDESMTEEIKTMVRIVGKLIEKNQQVTVAV